MIYKIVKNEFGNLNIQKPVESYDVSLKDNIIDGYIVYNVKEDDLEDIKEAIEAYLVGNNKGHKSK
jgi:hypothetical protein